MEGYRGIAKARIYIGLPFKLMTSLILVGIFVLSCLTPFLMSECGKGSKLELVAGKEERCEDLCGCCCCPLQKARIKRST